MNKERIKDLAGLTEMQLPDEASKEAYKEKRKKRININFYFDIEIVPKINLKSRAAWKKLTNVQKRAVLNSLSNRQNVQFSEEDNMFGPAVRSKFADEILSELRSLRNKV